MIKISVIIVISLILSLLLKKRSPVFAFFVTLGAVILVFLSSLDDLKSAADSIEKISSHASGISSYIKIMFKILAVTLLTQLVSDLCRDNGESALASQTELCGKIIITVISLPLFGVVIEIMTGLLK